MIELNDEEINNEIIDTIDEYLREYGDNIEYLDVYRICHKLIANLYDTQRDKYE